ncbi:MAG: DUF4886 domain-containing protein [Acholeplasmataceae bacterium]|jgi:hypothetical protein
MKKILYLLFLMLASFVFVACDKGEIPIDSPVITEINLADSSGQGTADDPFVFNAVVDDLISTTINVTPINVIKDLKFKLVKKVNNQYVELSNDDVCGLSFNEDNSNEKFSVKALVAGTFYVQIKQDSIAVYIQVNIQEKEDETVWSSVDFSENFKVLAIGNSFSNNAMTYLYEIANSYGVKNIVLGTIYLGGAELSQHANYAQSNRATYSYIKNNNGEKTTADNKTILDGLLDEDWDIIVIQQESGKSGKSQYYEPHLTNLLAYINEHKTNQEANVLWYLVWAYQADCTEYAFSYFYQSNQTTMYEEIVNAYLENVKPHEEIAGLIPTGTAIQNVRTSRLGDTLTRDGYHLNDIGCFIAGLSWFKSITGFDIDEITYRPYGVNDDEFKILVEAINNAITNPFEVTQSSFPE